MAGPRSERDVLMSKELRRLLRNCPMPGASVAVLPVEGDPVVEHAGVEVMPGGRPIDDRTRWDLASLTKVLVTLPATLDLVDTGRLDLDRQIADQWIPAATSPVGRASPADLLSFRAGLPAWRPFYAERESTREAIVSAALATPLVREPGGPAEYSDIGLLLLGELVADLGGVGLDRLASGLGVRYGPVEAPVAATEECLWRGRLIHGEVHDENAWAMGGVAGHAGVFATVGEVARLVRAWLAPDAQLRRDLVSMEWSRNDQGDRFGLGWWLPSTRGISGSRPGPGSFGASGFTGNRIWTEPERGYAVVILSNRIHPRRVDRAPFSQWCATLLDRVAELMLANLSPGR